MNPSTFRIKLGFCDKKTKQQGRWGRYKHTKQPLLLAKAAEDGSHFGRSDLFDFQSVVQQMGGGEVLLHKVLQDLDPHVWVVNLGDA